MESDAEEVHLPVECVRHILSFLHVSDFSNVLLVSKIWLEAARCTQVPFWCVS